MLIPADLLELDGLRPDSVVSDRKQYTFNRSRFHSIRKKQVREHAQKIEGE